MTEPAPLITIVPSVLPEEPFSADPVREPLWRQLGADRCRVAAVNLQTARPVAWRWMRDGGVSSGQGDAQPLDHILPGADTLLDNWIAHTAGEPVAVVTHMLSPRRWVYFWRASEEVGLLVQIHFLTGRNTSHAFDTAGVRVLCEHWLADELRSQGATAAPGWNQVERRARAPLPRAMRMALACLAGCLLLALWLATFGAAALADSHAAQQRDVARLAQLSNQSLQMHLVQALAGGDYGLAQEVLSLHKSVDHFAAAAVLNSRGLVVAHAGFLPPLPVGQALPARVRDRAQAMPLNSGSNAIGEVLLIAAPNGVTEGVTSPATLWRVAGVVLAALSLLGGWLIWRQHARRHGPEAIARAQP